VPAGVGGVVGESFRQEAFLEAGLGVEYRDDDGEGGDGEEAAGGGGDPRRQQQHAAVDGVTHEAVQAFGAQYGDGGGGGMHAGAPPEAEGTEHDGGETGRSQRAAGSAQRPGDGPRLAGRTEDEDGQQPELGGDQ
jgi:hypothetical protein